MYRGIEGVLSWVHMDRKLTKNVRISRNRLTFEPVLASCLSHDRLLLNGHAGKATSDSQWIAVLISVFLRGAVSLLEYNSSMGRLMH